MANRPPPKPEESAIHQPTPKRNSTLFQRLSSYMPSNPLRKPTPKQRPRSAPGHLNASDTRSNPSPAMNDPRRPLLHPPNMEIPMLSQDDPCPYDPEHYYSFPTFQQSRPNSIFSALCPGSPRRTSGQSADSGRNSRGSRGSINYPCPSGKSSPCGHLSSTDGDRSPRSRPVSPRLATVTEFGSEKTSSRGTIRAGAGRAASVPFAAFGQGGQHLSSSPGRPPTRHGPIPGRSEGFTFDTAARSSQVSGYGRPSSPNTRTKESPSPKLHHIHGLPNAQDYPYVHHRDVPKYSNGPFAPPPNPPPAASSSRTTRRPATASTVQDYSGTIYYPPFRGYPPPTSPRSSISKEKERIQNEQDKKQKKEKKEKQKDNRRPSISPPTRSNLPKGITVSFADSRPSSARTSVTVAGGEASSSAGGDRQAQRFSVDTDTTIVNTSGSEAESLHSRERAESSDTSTSPSTPSTQSTRVGGYRLELRGGNQIPRLRGGGKSGEKRIPKLLWWTAGGTGKPITVEQWKRQKPKRRQGGFLGLLMHGRKAGMAYEDRVERRVVKLEKVGVEVEKVKEKKKVGEAKEEGKGKGKGKEKGEEYMMSGANGPGE